MDILDRDIEAGVLQRGLAQQNGSRKEAAVLVALVARDPALPPAQVGNLDLVLEVRASTLAVQPGEVSLPGGSVEPGETPAAAAARECAEELLVEPGQIDLLGPLGTVSGPAGIRLHAFCGLLSGYADTFSKDEVERVFRLPLSWLLEHEPACYEVGIRQDFPEDFPWDRVPGGRSYRWRTARGHIPFYDTDPVIWGATARVLERFSRVVRAGLSGGA